MPGAVARSWRRHHQERPDEEERRQRQGCYKVPLLQTDHSPLGPLPRPGLYLYERRVHGASDAMAALFAAAAVYRWKAERLRRVEPPRWAG
jgi:hypothetical protein